MDNIFWDLVRSLLKEQLNFDLIDFGEINEGGNNRLFKLNSPSSKLLLKLYKTPDDRHRLQREFEAFQFLRSKHINQVPEAYLVNLEDYFAIYSFVSGKITKAADLDRAQITALMDFIITLHRLLPNHVDHSFLPSIGASNCLQDYVTSTKTRINKLKTHIATEGSTLLEKYGFPLDFEQSFDQLFTQITASYSAEYMSSQLTSDQLRLSPVDFGPHNTLFQSNGKPMFIDFEYFGWDDPYRLIGDFLNHDQSIDISDEDKKFALKYYIEQMKLDQPEQDRLIAVIKLMSLEWLGVYLQSMTREKLNLRKFADIHFNEEEYIAKQVAKFQSRLKKVQADV